MCNVCLLWIKSRNLFRVICVFIRGVVDTNALPLNISREILQDNAVMTRLRSALVKRILDMLDKAIKR